MGEGLRSDLAGRLPLRAIVADRRGGLEPRLKIARLEQTALARGEAPDPGEAVGLQFLPDRQCVPRGLTHAGALLLDPLGDTQHVLHVVSDLMGDHVGPREVAGRAEPTLQFLKERQVQIQGSLRTATIRTAGTRRTRCGGC